MLYELHVRESLTLPAKNHRSATAHRGDRARRATAGAPLTAAWGHPLPWHSPAPHSTHTLLSLSSDVKMATLGVLSDLNKENQLSMVQDSISLSAVHSGASGPGLGEGGGPHVSADTCLLVASTSAPEIQGGTKHSSQVTETNISSTPQFYTGHYIFKTSKKGKTFVRLSYIIYE